MEVSAEAKRIMVVALGKLYSSRSQRGGLRLHRSLLLTLVMKSARDIYHEAQANREEAAASEWEQAEQPQAWDNMAPASSVARQEEEVEEEEETAAASEVVTGESADAQNKENQCPSECVRQQSRKRRGKAAAEPDFLPCKKAKLEQGNCPPAPHLLTVNPVLMDYVNCSSGLGAHPSPMTLHRAAVAAC